MGLGVAGLIDREQGLVRSAPTLGWRDVPFIKLLQARTPRTPLWIASELSVSAWGERAVGAPLRFAFRSGKLPSFEGEMIAYDPPSALEFKWGEDALRLEVRPDDDGTVLTLLDTLDDRGKAARDGAGWHVCLDFLAAHLRGEETEDTESTTAWEDVHPDYVERFGPEAATIGPP